MYNLGWYCFGKTFSRLGRFVGCELYENYSLGTLFDTIRARHTPIKRVAPTTTKTTPDTTHKNTAPSWISSSFRITHHFLHVIFIMESVRCHSCNLFVELNTSKSSATQACTLKPCNHTVCCCCMLETFNSKKFWPRCPSKDCKRHVRSYVISDYDACCAEAHQHAPRRVCQTTSLGYNFRKVRTQRTFPTWKMFFQNIFIEIRMLFALCPLLHEPMSAAPLLWRFATHMCTDNLSVTVIS